MRRMDEVSEQRFKIGEAVEVQQVGGQWVPCVIAAWTLETKEHFVGPCTVRRLGDDLATLQPPSGQVGEVILRDLESADKLIRFENDRPQWVNMAEAMELIQKSIKALRQPVETVSPATQVMREMIDRIPDPDLRTQPQASEKCPDCGGTQESPGLVSLGPGIRGVKTCTNPFHSRCTQSQASVKTWATDNCPTCNTSVSWPVEGNPGTALKCPKCLTEWPAPKTQAPVVEVLSDPTVDQYMNAYDEDGGDETFGKLAWDGEDEATVVDHAHAAGFRRGWKTLHALLQSKGGR